MSNSLHRGTQVHCTCTLACCTTVSLVELLIKHTCRRRWTSDQGYSAHSETHHGRSHRASRTACDGGAWIIRLHSPSAPHGYPPILAGQGRSGIRRRNNRAPHFSAPTHSRSSFSLSLVLWFSLSLLPSSPPSLSGHLP